MNQTRVWLRTNRRHLFFIVSGALFLGFILIYRLGSLNHTLAPTEERLPTFNTSLHQLWDDPLNLPLILGRLVIAGLLSTGGNTASRLPSAVLGFLCVGLFYWLLRRWYGWRTAAFGAFMLAVSPWFLHSARYAGPAIVYPFSLTLLLTINSLFHLHPRRRYYYLSSLVWLSMLYVPGMIWFAAAVVFLEHDHILNQLRDAKPVQIAVHGLSQLVLLIPLIHALIVHPSLYKSILGLPARWPSLHSIGVHMVDVPVNIFIRGPLSPVANLGRLPLVNSFTIGMFLVGIYFYSQHRMSSRTLLLLGLIVLGVILTGLQGGVMTTVMMPIIFIIAAGGIGYILHEWLRVFPKNPIARSFGIGVVIIALAFSATYNLRQYFIAWPHSEATRTSFQQRL